MRSIRPSQPPDKTFSFLIILLSSFSFYSISSFLISLFQHLYLHIVFLFFSFPSLLCFFLRPFISLYFPLLHFTSSCSHSLNYHCLLAKDIRSRYSQGKTRPLLSPAYQNKNIPIPTIYTYRSVRADLTVIRPHKNCLKSTSNWHKLIPSRRHESKSPFSLYHYSS